MKIKFDYCNFLYHGDVVVEGKNKHECKQKFYKWAKYKHIIEPEILKWSFVD